VVTLVLLGRLLEAHARRSAAAAKLRPETARIERNGEAMELPAEALRNGDIAVLPRR